MPGEIADESGMSLSPYLDNDIGLSVKLIPGRPLSIGSDNGFSWCLWSRLPREVGEVSFAEELNGEDLENPRGGVLLSPDLRASNFSSRDLS